MKIIVILVAAVFLTVPPLGAAAPEPARDIFEATNCIVPESQVDKLVNRKLSKLRIRPALCSDAVFVRRAFLDITGTLPTAKEAREFLKSSDPDKRRKLIDKLLERDEYADYWAMKWGDILRIKAEFPVNLWPNAAQAYHHWIRTAIRDNMPYDQFAREMLTASGSNFRVGPVNFYRAMQNRTPEGIAAAVALTFMGARVESWPREKLEGMAVFFEQVGYKPTREWKEEIVFWDPNKNDQPPSANSAPTPAANTNTVPPASNTADRAAAGKTAAKAPPAPMFPDGKKLKQLPPDVDPRQIFADWLITPKNEWFARNIANRTWAWLLGRGIIEEPDDIRPDNPPSNPELLAYLQEELVKHNYDLKYLYRLILNSQTYQFSSIPPAKADQKAEANFAFYPLRRLEAEVLIDAINQITGTSDLYTSAIPEPFTYIPENMPAVAIPDGSITSPFLELFGRPARATGMENERVNRISATQRMHMLNSSHIQRKIEQGPGLKKIANQKRAPEDIMATIYLAVLSRFPTADEVKFAQKYAQGGVARGRDAWVDLVWALINSDEFLYRH